MAHSLHLKKYMSGKSKKTMFVCSKCGPFVRVYKELWTEDSEGPYKLEFIQHIEGNAKIVDEVMIKSKPEGEVVEYSFCGKCKRLIDREQNMRWFEDTSPF
jgi:hypothetical protein